MNIINQRILPILLFFCLTIQKNTLAQEHQTIDIIRKTIQTTVKDSLIKLSKNTYAIIANDGGMAGNILVYECKTGFIIIDDQWDELNSKVTDLLKTISSKPIIYILNSHFHFDHTDGNKALGKTGIKIIAHDNLRKRLLSDQSVAPPTDMIQKKYPFYALPYITFSDSLTLHEEGEDIKIFHVNNAHTDTDSFIEFENDNVYHTGDVFVRYGFPFIDDNNGGNIFGIIKSVNELIARTNDSTIIIPGHGPISHKKDLIVYRNNLQLIVNRIKDGILNNLTVEQIEQKNPTKGINWWNGYFVTSRIYKMVKASL
jgi:glyoxylase-like metal-dependent hydrolase (beta-lactamase superfamily II)